MGSSEIQRAARQEEDLAKVKLQFLSGVQLFKRLPKAELPTLADMCTLVEFKAKQTVIKQGAAGNEFFIIAQGEATVTVDRGDGSPAMVVATLKAGDYFGENSLLRSEPRSATITAVTSLSTYMITRSQFQAAGLQDRLHFASRKAVGGGGHHTEAAQPPSDKTPSQAQFIANTLRANRNLESLVSLNQEMINQLVRASWKEAVPAGKEIITQGDIIADYFYIVQDGCFEIVATLTEEQVDAEQRAKHANDAGLGDAIGHLMTGMVSTFTSMTSEAAGHATAGKSIRSTSKESARTTASSRSVKSTKSIEGAQSEFHKAAPRAGGPSRARRAGPQTICTVGRGGSFGELALLYSVPRAATVVAKESSNVWVIDRSNFKAVLVKACEEKTNIWVTYLDEVRLLDPLSADEKQAIAKAMDEVHFAEGEVIVQQGEVGNTFYVLFDGEVSVAKDGEQEKRLEGKQRASSALFFGERSLLGGERHAATVTVCSESAKALALTRETFDIVLGPLESILKRTQEGAPSVRKHRFSMKDVKWRKDADRPRIPRERLLRVGLLGVGSFGCVELWAHRDTQECYALKGVSKGMLMKMDMKESILNERSIMMMVDCPFIIRLYETYNGAQFLYFLLEPALGGELFSTYGRKNFYGILEFATFYSACVALAFAHMHGRHIVYRDTKPENMVLTAKGYLKVADLGLAKFVIGKTFTTCGTPDYFAPEVIDSTGHCHAVDWWGLGVLIFELMTGGPPFAASSPMESYAKVMAGVDKVTFPEVCEAPCVDLVKALLQKDPSDRLPMRPGGIRHLKEHAFYGEFEWEALESLQMEPPYEPNVKGKMDISNFHVDKEDLPRNVLFVSDGSDWDKEFATA